MTRFTWFQGWNIVAAVFITQGLAIGLTTASYGAYVLPVSRDFEVSIFSVTLGHAMLLLGLSVASPFVGRLLQRSSIRISMMKGFALIGSGMLLMSMANHIAAFIAIYATLVALGSTLAGAIPSSTLVVNWFSERRGRALGISTIGASAGGLVLPPIAAALIEGWGWRSALQIMALGAVLVAWPIIYWVISDRPQGRDHLAGASVVPELEPGEELSQIPSSRKVITSRAFWTIAIGAGLGNCVTSGVMINVVPFAVGQGHSYIHSAYLISLFTIGLVLGKLLIGFASDRIAIPILWRLSLILAAAGVLLLAHSSSMAGLMAACFICGIGSGGYYPLIGMSISATFPHAAFSKVIGLALPALYIFAMPGAPVAGLIFDRSGSYIGAFWLFAALLVAATLSISLGGRSETMQKPTE